MRNILSRDEFLSQTNESRFGDAIKRGFKKLKNLFSIAIKKVKDFIFTFDSNGNILPVVTPQATFDHFHDSDVVGVYTSRQINESIKDAGGNPAKTSAPLINDETIVGSDPVDEDSYEKRNFEKLLEVLKEGFTPDGEPLNERVNYSKMGAHGVATKVIDGKKFEEMLRKRIVERHNLRRLEKEAKKEGEKYVAYGNMLVFGAPGIGKSTIPDSVIRTFNEMNASGDPKKSMSLITVNCANIPPGEFLMPTIPIPKDMSKFLKDNSDAVDVATLNTLDDEDRERLEAAFNSQHISGDIPKSWLPCYKETGDAKLNLLLDDYANCNMMVDKDDPTESYNTGGGGIILLDELFRAKPTVYDEFLTLLLNRRVGEWKIGSKWFFLACSNRPIDSFEVNERMSEVDSAFYDRFSDVVLLQPNIEGWKEWMRGKGLKGENEILFKYIFDEKAKDGDEYRRWHSTNTVDEISSSDGKTLPLTPRRWFEIWNTFKKEMKEKEVKSILDFSVKELEEVIGTMISPDDTQEFVEWFRNNTGNVNIDDIIEDPMTKPKKYGRSDDLVVISNLYEQFCDRFYQDEKITCTEQELTNIVQWIGMNYPEQFNIFLEEFWDKIDQQLDKFGIDKGEFFEDKLRTVNMILAAYPDVHDFEGRDTVEDGERVHITGELEDADEDRVQEVKTYMKKFFPWRIKGDRVLYMNVFDDKKKEKK